MRVNNVNISFIFCLSKMWEMMLLWMCDGSAPNCIRLYDQQQTLIPRTLRTQTTLYNKTRQKVHGWYSPCLSLSFSFPVLQTRTRFSVLLWAIMSSSPLPPTTGPLPWWSLFEMQMCHRWAGWHCGNVAHCHTVSLIKVWVKHVSPTNYAKILSKLDMKEQDSESKEGRNSHRTCDLEQSCIYYGSSNHLSMQLSEWRAL